MHTHTIKTIILYLFPIYILLYSCKSNPSTKAVQQPTKKTVVTVVSVELLTTKGKIVLDVHRDWSPKGADRFLQLVKEGYYNDIAFFRVIEGFMAQTGISGDPKKSIKWMNNNIEDEPVKQSNKRGYISFAKTALPNTRSTQFFINFVDNSQLDGMGFAPFAKVRDMSIVDQLYKGYAESPNQSLIQRAGNTYLRSTFPSLDYIVQARITD